MPNWFCLSGLVLHHVYVSQAPEHVLGLFLMDIPCTEHAYRLQVLRSANSFRWNVDSDAFNQADLSAFDLAQPGAVCMHAEQ